MRRTLRVAGGRKRPAYGMVQDVFLEREDGTPIELDGAYDGPCSTLPQLLVVADEPGHALAEDVVLVGAGNAELEVGAPEGGPGNVLAQVFRVHAGKAPDSVMPQHVTFVGPDGLSFGLAAVRAETLEVAGAASVDVGGTAKLTATADLNDGRDGVDVSEEVTWKSSDASKATVAPDGTVTWKGPGKVTITAEYGGKSATHEMEMAVPVYGVRFEGEATAGTRTGMAAGLDFAPSVGTKAGHSGFDRVEPWDFPLVKVSFAADGTPREEAVWEHNGTGAKPANWDTLDLDVFARIRNFWFRDVEEYDGDTLVDVREVSTYQFPGSHPMFTLDGTDSGTMPEWLPYVGVYRSRKVGGKTVSRAGGYPGYGNYANWAASDKAASPKCHSNPSWYGQLMRLLPVIECADRDVQYAIGRGFCDGRYSNKQDKAQAAAVASDVASPSEEDVILAQVPDPVPGKARRASALAEGEASNTVRIAPASAANYLVGQGAFIGPNSWTVKVDDRTITAIDAATGDVTLDGEPFTVTPGTDILSNIDWKCGSCSGIAGHTGQPVADGRHPVVWRGIEAPWGGGNEPVIDLRMVLAGGAYATRFCPDPIKARDATADVPTADFKDAGLTWPSSTNYTKRVATSAAYPCVAAPAEVGGGASDRRYQADYYWINTEMPDNRAPRSGYFWATGAHVGAFCRYAYNSAADSNRGFSSRLFAER